MKFEKETVLLGISVFLIVIGCGLLIAGICIPPVGVIDNSILISFGEIGTFVGAILGIDGKYKSIIKRDERKI